MTEKKTNPIATLKDELFYLRMAHEEVVAAEERLTKLRNTFNDKRAGMTSIYSNAVALAERLGETLGTDFMEGQILIQFDEEHRAEVTHVPHQESYMLLSLVDRAEQAEKSDQPAAE
ncbi:hypothetical protein [Pseudomonas asplenii]|uniref:hypothetical protein n=1 Tax=Pseudomonas asplenii TaxID=53407 RepID=UPI0023617BFF|nr:hypothetical protein [Pseudomonas asplenii]